VEKVEIYIQTNVVKAKTLDFVMPKCSIVIPNSVELNLVVVTLNLTVVTLHRVSCSSVTLTYML